MSVEGYDYQRSSERLDLAVSLAEIQAITAGIKLVTTAPPAVTDKSDYDWHVDTKTKEEVLKNEKWFNADGSPKWPENDGFEGTPTKIVLKPGTRIDRYGGETGTFVAPEGTPYQNRSLPPGKENDPYNVYKVKKPLEVEAGVTAPWFGEPGGGIQFKLPYSIKELRRQKIIKKY